MQKKRILLVDDEKGFTDMVKLNLESVGEYEVKSVNNAQSALKEALRFRPDLILLDIIMPGMEGPDVYLALKSNREIRNTPILFFSQFITYVFIYDASWR